MKIYYLNTEYETGKHEIIHVWAEYIGITPPDAYIHEAYSTVEFDEYYNRNLARLIYNYSREDVGLPNAYYIDNSENIVETDSDKVVTINANPQKESYKLSQLYGLTHQQLDSLVDGLETMEEYREAFRKALHVILYLVKQTKLDA